MGVNVLSFSAMDAVFWTGKGNEISGNDKILSGKTATIPYPASRYAWPIATYPATMFEKESLPHALMSSCPSENHKSGTFFKEAHREIPTACLDPYRPKIILYSNITACLTYFNYMFGAK